jgi:hypothetical protein
LKVRDKRTKNIANAAEGKQSFVKQNSDFILPTVKNGSKLEILGTHDTLESPLPRDSNYGAKSNRANHRLSPTYSSINKYSQDSIRYKNQSTLEPRSVRHQDLLTSKDNLTGLTSNNEWDEIWKYAKIKDVEENAIKKNKKLAQKIQFNTDLRAQILEKQKQRNKEVQENKNKEREVMDSFQKKIKLEDNKKMIAKIKGLEQLKYNDNILLQKNQFNKEMLKEQKKYDKVLVDDLVIENNVSQHRSFTEVAPFVSTKDPRSKLRISDEQIFQDKLDLKEYSKIFDKLEQEKKDRFTKVKHAYDHQPKSIPREKEKNIYGMSEKEEETHMYNRMQKEAVEDKKSQYLKRIEKQRKQHELREYYNMQVKDKAGNERIEKFKNSFYNVQIQKDIHNYEEGIKNIKSEKHRQEQTNFNSITQQIHQKHATSPELIIDKFGVGGMNREEFLMNKNILNDISKKKMEFMNGQSNHNH